jgi:hypothetical protein
MYIQSFVVNPKNDDEPEEDELGVPEEDDLGVPEEDDLGVPQG